MNQDQNKKQDQRLKLLLKDCANGFYQQMYFLGKDVTHQAGNQLSKYGFIKAPSKGLKGTSCYTLRCTLDQQNYTIELYGSCAGIYSHDTSLVFIRERCKFFKWLPKHRLIAGQWSSDELQALSAEEMFHSLTPFFQWWVEYEKWIDSRLGQEYRENCYTAWKKVKSKPPWLPPRLASQWITDFLENKDSQIRPKEFLQQQREMKCH